MRPLTVAVLSIGIPFAMPLPVAAQSQAPGMSGSSPASPNGGKAGGRGEDGGDADGSSNLLTRDRANNAAPVTGTPSGNKPASGGGG